MIHLNNDYVPRLRINKTYKEFMTKGVLTPKEKEYVRSQMRAGKFLINSIEQRQNTIERITRKILNKQEEFFIHGPSKLRPMTMAEVAEEIDVHETTVSRAIANKYVRTPHGLFPVQIFLYAWICRQGWGYRFQYQCEGNHRVHRRAGGSEKTIERP